MTFRTLFVVVLFVDSANPTNLLPGSVTAHFQEVIGFACGYAFGGSPNLLTRSEILPSSTGHNHSSRHPGLIFLDQDGPSLAPSTHHVVDSGLSHGAAVDPRTPSLIYLWNRSLLI
ncbi:MAG TPA: hypothetical protein VMM57_01805 [Bacteroidota bacterium]|nr:hypothetical protein [Bacteroidota bacterium]